ncbi:MAG: TolB family protein, partial [Rhodanobacteraceae bacterium]
MRGASTIFGSGRGAAAVALVGFVGLGATFGSYLFGPSVPLRQANLQAVPLTTSEGEEVFPSFSPDGTQVAFAWNGKDRAGYDIYVKVIGSPDELRLTDDPASEIRPAWSPDGSRIAYIRWTAAAQTIYLVSRIGGAKRKVAEFSNLGDSNLAWWPDSKSLV